MKQCLKCHIEKEDSCFGKSKQTKDGLFQYCYECAAEKSTEYRRRRGIPPLKRASEYVLPEQKKCTVCKEVKPINDFRIVKQYPNSSCLLCDKKRAKVYYDKQKDDEVFKLENCKRANKYRTEHVEDILKRRNSESYKRKHADWENKRYHRLADVIKVKMKVKRQTPEYKAKMKEYRDINKEKLHQKAAITKRRYHEKHRDNLTDEYITRQLITQGVADRETVAACPDLITAKRIQLLIKRKIQNNVKN